MVEFALILPVMLLIAVGTVARVPASSITRRTFFWLSSLRYGITTEWKTAVVTPGRES